MNISFSATIKKHSSLCVLVPEKNGKAPKYPLLSSDVKKEIEERIKKKHFEGKLGECLELKTSEKNIERVFIVGQGKEKEFNNIRKSAGNAIRKIKKYKIKDVALLGPEGQDLEKIISGVVLGSYEFKIGDLSERFMPEKITILSSSSSGNPKDLEAVIALAQSTNFLRDLVNLPANLMTPSVLAEKSKEVAQKNKKIKVTVLGEKEILKNKMGALYSVGLGSEEESKVIVLEYYGGAKDEAPVAFLGKGVTFDSGGYNLKPTNHIETMKCDMTGAATVLGLFDWVAQTSPSKNIIGVIGAVENMVSRNAYKPGDIITAMNGKTIEITNTDAEGRLVLADCLFYTATKYKPRFMMDIATLTGAVGVALGNEITGVMGNDPSLLKKVKSCAEKEEEWVWELPLIDFFKEKTKGSISDLVNWTAGVSAGSSMGAAFLQNFIQDTPWVHFDIGSTAFHDKSGDELSPKGATGVMLRTFTQIVKSV